MRKQEKGTEVLRSVFMLGLALVVLTVTSLSYDLRSIDEEYRLLAAEMARSFFQAINTMRSWSLEHGGFYIAGGKDVRVNRYVPESMRSVKTIDGRTLVMVNHAQMTRLFSDLLNHQRGISMHMTDLTPLRPENDPDPWERAALIRFVGGSREVYDVVGDDGAEVFRYMAPLRAQPECYQCHVEHSAINEEFRGGISVSLPYAPFLRVISRERAQIILAHVALSGLGLGILLLTGRRLYKSVTTLEHSLTHIRRLEGLLPICATCKKIRLPGTDYRIHDSWIPIERYIQERTNAEFTHGACPECAQKQRAEILASRESPA